MMTRDTPDQPSPFYQRIPRSLSKALIAIGTTILVVAAITAFAAKDHIRERTLWKERFQEHVNNKGRIPHPGIYTTDWHDVRSQRFQIEMAKYSTYFGATLAIAGGFALLGKHRRTQADEEVETPS